jgi:hypothetical protein
MVVERVSRRRNRHSFRSEWGRHLIRTFWPVVALLLGLHTPACAAEVGDESSEAFGLFGAAAEQARATQPAWSSALVTTTGLMEQRFRFDIAEQHSGNGVNTTALDGGRGLDLIVTDSNEVQIGLPPYDIRSHASHIPGITGFADWPFVRIEQRLASSPENQGNYVLTAWLQVQAPSGIARLTTGAWTYTPTIAFGKGWGAFDVQGTIAAALPASHTSTLGYQVQANLALQYHLLAVLWPELEVNWTWYANGQRGGLNQIYLTAGFVAGRFQLTQRLRLTIGAGHQFAVAPMFRAKPLTPAYNDAWLLTSRFNF